MVVPPKYFFHAINVQQLIYVLYNKKCKWYFLFQYFLSAIFSLWVENFNEIARSRTVKEIQVILCFAIFGENSKWPPFLGRGKFFENCQEYIP